MASSLSERRKDPAEIAEVVGLPDRVGSYAAMILERLQNDGYQLPADARTYPAVVYFAARDEGEPVTAGEVASAAGVDETAVAREFRRVVEALDKQPEHPDVEAFVNRFVRELDASDETVEVALDLLREGEEANLFPNRTRAVAGALCVYAASRLTGDDLTQVDFETFGVSRTSIRKGYKSVLSLRDEPSDDGKLNAENARDLLTDAVKRVQNALDYPDPVLDDALAYAHDIADVTEFVEGKSPEPIAAALYWIAAEENRMDLSQSAAADALGVHKVTVNRRVASIRDLLDV